MATIQPPPCLNHPHRHQAPFTPSRRRRLHHLCSASIMPPITSCSAALLRRRCRKAHGAPTSTAHLSLPHREGDEEKKKSAQVLLSRSHRRHRISVLAVAACPRQARVHLLRSIIHRSSAQPNRCKLKPSTRACALILTPTASSQSQPRPRLPL
ncbi:hypothetical protein M0R45_018841 [Rubus argutus]|uniref:Uncharacterized protein n=1 Tax=Rubus argutus TaxID=59490 RepID=A0AAW1X5K7_RUBAR